ncbi:MAG: phytanoyl-CoA dioxygenase family protein [Candidatus Poribacteria bacterium]|nr:phytanoyl-CoA dioxygenase family protein [Candidatus Poribacteria bacterium]
MPLNSDHLRLFRHNGFLQMPTRLSMDHVAKLKDAIWRDVENVVEPVVRNRDGKIVRLSNLWDRARIFRDTIACHEILEPLKLLIGPNIEYIRNRHNHTTLRLRGDYAQYHRDVMQWSRTICTIIVYLEDTNLDNGCTRAVPGSHLLPSLSVKSLYESDWIRESGLMEQAVPVPMPAGGMLVIDSMLIHAAGENHTDETRMSMTFGYHAVDELNDTDNSKRVLLCGERPYLGNDK